MVTSRGGVSEPSTYGSAAWLFLRVPGVFYLIAFWSLGEQITGLIGRDGILPAEPFLEAARAQTGLERFWRLPTLAWIDASDAALQALCATGAALALLPVAGLLPLVVLPLLWATYLSLSVVCREFLGYQWDALLLEAGFLAIFLRHQRQRDQPGVRRHVNREREAGIERGEQQGAHLTPSVANRCSELRRWPMRARPTPS